MPASMPFCCMAQRSGWCGLTLVEGLQLHAGRSQGKGRDIAKAMPSSTSERRTAPDDNIRGAALTPRLSATTETGICHTYLASVQDHREMKTARASLLRRQAHGQCRSRRSITITTPGVSASSGNTTQRSMVSLSVTSAWPR